MYSSLFSARAISRRRPILLRLARAVGGLLGALAKVAPRAFAVSVRSSTSAPPFVGARGFITCTRRPPRDAGHCELPQIGGWLVDSPGIGQPVSPGSRSIRMEFGTAAIM